MVFEWYLTVAVLDSVYRGPGSKMTFIVRPLHIKLHLLHLYTFKLCLKMHGCVLKIFGLAISMHASTFPQDFPQLIFQQGGPNPLPLKLPMEWNLNLALHTCMLDMNMLAHTHPCTHTQTPFHLLIYHMAPWLGVNTCC